jgi:hypothetical protein
MNHEEKSWERNHGGLLQQESCEPPLSQKSAGDNSDSSAASNSLKDALTTLLGQWPHIVSWIAISLPCTELRHIDLALFDYACQRAAH